MERYAKQRKRSWKKDRQYLDRDLLPRFRHRKADKIARREIIDLLEEIRDRGAPVGANRCLEVARKIFNFGIEREILAVNPCARVDKVGQETRGDRWLNPSEIKKVWPAMDGLPVKWRAFLRLCLLTGQHPGEILLMQRGQVERAGVGAWWVMPEGLHKADWAHSVYLTPLALSAFEDACAESSDPNYLFPARGGGAANPANAPWQKPTEKLVDLSGVKRFTGRDFRPTVSTGMQSEPLSIPQVIVAKVLGHTNREITDRYTRHGYDPEKRRAIEAWSRRVLDIVEGKDADSNVVPLAAGSDRA